jgi:2'-hydroxyisoflavone reductase
MRTTRREFLELTTVAAGAATLGTLSSPEPRGITRRATRVLVLGGTGFIGPHIVRALLGAGHEVSIFTRGRRNTDLFPEVERLIGDRGSDLSALEGRYWDVVIDNSASRVAGWVRDSANMLHDHVDTYLVTSTPSVYGRYPTIGMNEDSPILDPDPAAIDEGRELSYGVAKSTMEYELRQVFGDRALIVRPGLIVGPGDNTDRFSYWPIRIDRGGEVLAPGDPDNKCMFIDVRDLADWYVHLIEQKTTGILNALGPEAPLSFAELLYGIRAVTTSNVKFTWVDTDFLLDHGVRPYSDMPLWIPARGDRIGFQRFDLSKPLANGIKYRPLAVTARDTLEFHYSRSPERQRNLRAGIDAEREQEVLAAWHSMG